MLYPILEQYDVDIKKALAYGFVREGEGLTLRKPLPEAYHLFLRAVLKVKFSGVSGHGASGTVPKRCEQ